MSFTIGKKFKAGADGILYQGDNGLGRTVAIKIIGPSCGDPEFVKRQAEALARVESPHVVDVIVVAEFDDPADPGTTRHGIVMEWLDGQTFREIIAGSVLKPDEARRIGVGMIDGLHAIHQSGLAHTDLHHDNVMIGPAFVKILDIRYRKTLKDDSEAAKQSALKQDRNALAALLNQALNKAQIDPAKVAAFNNTLASDDSLAATRTAFETCLTTETIDVPKQLEHLTKRLTEQSFVATEEYATLLADSTPDQVIRPLIEHLIDKGVVERKHRKYIRAVWSRLGQTDRAPILGMLAEQIDAQVPDGKFRPCLGVLASFGESGWNELRALTRIRLEKAMTNNMRQGRHNTYQGFQEGALGLWCAAFYPFFTDQNSVLDNVLHLLGLNWDAQNYIAEYFMHILDDLPKNAEQREALTTALVGALDNKAYSVKQQLTKIPQKWREEIESRVAPDAPN